MEFLQNFRILLPIRSLLLVERFIMLVYRSYFDPMYLRNYKLSEFLINRQQYNLDMLNKIENTSEVSLFKEKLRNNTYKFKLESPIYCTVMYMKNFV